MSHKGTRKTLRSAKGRRFLGAALGLGAALVLVGGTAGFGDDKPVFQGIADRIRYRESFNDPFIDDTYSAGFWGQLARHTHHPVTHGPAAPPIVYRPSMTLRDWEAWKTAGQYPPGLASDTLAHFPVADEPFVPADAAPPFDGGAPWLNTWAPPAEPPADLP